MKKDADPGEVQRPTPLSPKRAISARKAETQRGAAITPRPVIS